MTEPRSRGGGRAILALPALLLLSACQAPPTQQVSLHLTPPDARVWVDGAELGAGTRQVELRSDEPHVVLAKRDGYRPQQVVLEPRDGDGGPALDPAEVRLELEPLVPTARAIRIEVED